MADAAISFAIETLRNLLIQKIKFIGEVKEQVEQLKDELETMKCFLNDASQKQAKNERVRKWISDVREVAFDAEDVITAFTLKVGQPNMRRGRLGRCVCYPTQTYYLNKLGKEIQSIRDRLEAIGQHRSTYGIENLEMGLTSSSDAVEQRRRVSPWKPDKHVVGLEGDVESLLERAVLVEKSGLSCSSIVGMGGVGKSTLAKRVYNHPSMSKRFECRAWVTVSRDFSRRELIKGVVMQLLESGEDKLKELQIMETLPEQQLKQMLYQRLEGKQYLIVLDDLWEQQHLDYLRSAFPDEQAKASRLLITSRNREILWDNAQYVHQLSGLDPEHSWQLFLKVALGDHTDGTCPPELKDTGMQIVERCAGLPLAITVIGGLLFKEGQSTSGWEKVLKEMQSQLALDTDNIGAILELSYQDLPSQLKSCFLCLSFFKEDAVIHSYELTQLWIAQGFVPDEKGIETREETATKYLTELVNRNLIQVEESFTYGLRFVEHMKMHDLLRDLSIDKAEVEMNFHVLVEGRSSVRSLNKARHLVVYNMETFTSSIDSLNPHLRSLVFLNEYGGDHIPSSSWKKFPSLRVLQLDRVGLTRIPKGISKLIGLKLLSLRSNSIKKLPRSLGHLKNLQTLDIRRNTNIIVPNVIWKLDSLRNLLMLSDDVICKEPLRLNTLKNLQMLEDISTKNVVLEHVGELVSLRVLSISCTEGSVAMDWIVNLQHLVVLGIQGSLKWLPNNFPQNISHLILNGSFLSEDPMPILKGLSNLQTLMLFEEAYIGETLEIEHNGFLRLQFLRLERLSKLRNIRIGNRVMPELKRFTASDCPMLESIVQPEEEELRILSNLQVLEITRASEELELKLQSDKYHHIISNIPSVKIQ